MAMMSKPQPQSRRQSFKVLASEYEPGLKPLLECDGAWEGPPQIGTHLGDPEPDIEHCSILPEPCLRPGLPGSLAAEAWSRGRWLVGLLILQSSSSFVLSGYSDLLERHLVVTLFLTMLVGAGGNAGNQSAIKVIRGLATGALRPTLGMLRATLARQAIVGLLLASGLASAGWVRVYLTAGDPRHASAIALSLLLIVNTSVLVGTALPFALARLGVDPANAGTSIQVVMDVMGVLITCACCRLVLDQLAGVLRHAPPLP
ncbi:hypothetical protein ACKKBF_B11140 [Auxenochlorella protothecoides x Auxenochlorella symbiontica]